MLFFPRIWHLASINFRPWLQVFTHIDNGKIWLQAFTWAPVTLSHFVIARISAHHETTANYFHITRNPGNLGVRPRPPSRWETVRVVLATSTSRRERETTSIFVVSAFLGGNRVRHKVLTAVKIERVFYCLLRMDYCHNLGERFSDLLKV